MTAARRCCRTWPSSPAARSSARRSGSSSRTSRSTCSARAKRVIITKDNTTIVDGGGDGDDVKGRINQIKAEIENTDSDWDREKLQERLAKLSGGVAVIKVGAATEVELKEKKHRHRGRASSATRAAIEEGVVAGGGTALHPEPAAVTGRRGLARRATRRPVPARCGRRSTPRPALIAENAGLEGSVVGAARSRARPAPTGLNAATGELTDLVKAGIIDPAKVTRAALQNAASIAAHGAHHRVPRGRQARDARRDRRMPAAAAWAAWVEWAAWG